MLEGKWRMRMKGIRPEPGKYVNCFAKAFMTAFALLTVFHAPLERAMYETTVDYIIASVYELLGNYDFAFAPVFIMCCLFYYHRYAADGERKGNGATAVFFGLCILISQSYYEIGNWDYCFGSAVNLVKFMLALAGYAFLFKSLMGLLEEALDKGTFTTRGEHFFSRHPFGKAFVIILAGYMPFLILSYPGNLCWDVIGQIEQVILRNGFSTHHPLAHTLLVGGLTQLGMTMFGSYEVGLFLYVCLQTILLASAMAFTIAVLVKRKADFKVILCVLLLYLVTPIYSNLTTTPLKDVPYTAFVTCYAVCFALLSETPELIKNRRFCVAFVLLQLGVILLRNNGQPLVLLSGLGGFLFTFKRYSVKERIKSLFVQFLTGVVLGSLIMSLLAGICSATPGSKGEMFSVFFQQTARYLQFYKAELAEEERVAIEAVLGDVNEVAAEYNPDIADPVKAFYQKDAATEELAAYLKAWFQGFRKHPAVYAEAFLTHVYGWFAPNVSNTVRYETDYDLIGQGLLFPDAEKVMVFFYRFAGRITPLGILENTGVAVWALFFYTNRARRCGRRDHMTAGLPLWVNLLICMASPCFFGHPRYALPILMGIPFLYGFTLTGSEVPGGEE